MHTGQAVHAHSSWLNGITIIFGYLWLISGIDKIASGVFVSGFSEFVMKNYITEGTYSWYISFIQSVVLPWGTLFAYVIEWGELAIGVVLIGGAVGLFFRDSRIIHLLLGLANLGGACIVANIIMAEGGSLLPFINSTLVYEEGVSIDVVVLLVSFLVAFANIIAFALESKPLNS
jgi:uncharacterized membrane protein YphA (DoxX/SURF4 family)